MNSYIALVDSAYEARVALPSYHHGTCVEPETGCISGLTGALSMWNGRPPTWCCGIVRVHSKHPWQAVPPGEKATLWERVEKEELEWPKFVKGCLDLSTAHAPCSEPDFGKVRYVESREEWPNPHAPEVTMKEEYGWVVWVQEPDEEGGGIPEWLLPIMRVAHTEGHILINFDRDADECPDFQTWEW